MKSAYSRVKSRRGFGFEKLFRIPSFGFRVGEPILGFLNPKHETRNAKLTKAHEWSQLTFRRRALKAGGYQLWIFPSSISAFTTAFA